MAEPAVVELTAKEPGITVQWRSFELRPEPVPLLDPDGAYLVSAWQNHVYPLAAKLKMDMKKPPIQTRSRLAHEAAKWAGEQGCFEDYNIAIFRAFFEHGRDIGDITVLKNLAENLNLDPTALEESLDKGEFTPVVLADGDEARRIGVRAVPAFAAGGRVLAAGVQTAERLRELLS